METIDVTFGINLVSNQIVFNLMSQAPVGNDRRASNCGDTDSIPVTSNAHAKRFGLPRLHNKDWIKILC